MAGACGRRLRRRALLRALRLPGGHRAITAAPTVSSTDYPSDAYAGGPGVDGTFTFRRSGQPVVAFEYDITYCGPSGQLVTTSGGRASVTITPTSAGPCRVAVRGAITPAPGWQLGAVQPADQRWRLARQLLHDDTLPTPDRVAGLLVLLYGQNLSRISRLRSTDVTTDPDDLAVRLGSAPTPSTSPNHSPPSCDGCRSPPASAPHEPFPRPSNGCSSAAGPGAPPTPPPSPTGSGASAWNPAPPATAPCSTSPSTYPPASWQTSLDCTSGPPGWSTTAGTHWTGYAASH